MSRFFLGTRNDSGSKKNHASAQFLSRLKNGGKDPTEPTPEEKYQAMFDKKMAGMQAEVNKSYSAFKLPGTKQDEKPREMSKTAKQMLQMLAEKKAKKEMKKMKMKAAESKRVEKQKAKLEEAKLKNKNTMWTPWGNNDTSNSGSSGNTSGGNNNAFWNPWGGTSGDDNNGGSGSNWW